MLLQDFKISRFRDFETQETRFQDFETQETRFQDFETKKTTSAMALVELASLAPLHIHKWNRVLSDHFFHDLRSDQDHLVKTF